MRPMNNHFDPFMGSKLPSELKRPLRRVKTTLLQKGRKLPLGVKTTLLNLQCIYIFACSPLTIKIRLGDNFTGVKRQL